MKHGILYNVGVGPGDPELLTLKAVRILRECTVIAIPQMKKDSCVAYQIARQAVPQIEEKDCLCLHMPMTKDKETLEKSHKEAAEQVKKVLQDGKDVALLTLGDSTIYATSLYIQERIQKEGFSSCMVNGIPSFCAAAARLNLALVSGAEQLHIIPASYPAQEAEKWSGVKVLMKAGSKVALYGAGAGRTIKGGTGSGDVNERERVSVFQGMKNAGFQVTTEAWIESYDQIYENARQEWKRSILSKTGEGADTMDFFTVYSTTPFKMPAGDPIQKPAEGEDTENAIYVLSRIAGEGSDRTADKGDYDLSEEEHQMLADICAYYKNVVVVINAGAQVDLSFMDEFRNIRALLVIVQPGMEGGNAFADILSGKVNPSGKLADTWAYKYEDYPSSEKFSHNNGNVETELYDEGIYVGYRYFDTFEVPVRYGFGYGLSYTDFEITGCALKAVSAEKIRVTATVRNTGNVSGKEVVQVYYSAPDGTIEKPYQELGGFGKSDLLSPGESQTITISFPTRSMASYDEKKAAWVLEAGTYYIRVGNSSRTTKVAAALKLKETVVTVQGKNLFPADDAPQELSKAGVTPYSYEGEAEEKAAAKQIDICSKCIKTETVVYSETPEAFPAYEGEKLTAADVKSGKATLKDLVSQLTVEEMAAVCNGTADGLGQEGFIGSSSDMAPGAAGDTTSILLEDRGIYNTILADGPAGLRLIPHFVVDADGKMVSSGNPLEDAFNKNEIEVPEGGTEYFQYCTAIPVAALLAQSWNMDLIQKCGDIVGKEMEEFHISVWLAPGMNIHRNPLCGRNFEYYSEDPLVAGMCAAADTRGIQSHAGIGTSIKHFAANNQEDNRMYVNEHISERAMREIYLKGFEIAVKTAQPMTIMSSYNLVNGVHTANSHDLLTAAARDEWGFAGYVMTDWGTSEDMSGLFAYKYNLKYGHSTSRECVLAGNDLQMPGQQGNRQEIVASVADGTLPLGQLQTCAYRILNVVLQSLAYDDCKPYGDQFDLEEAVTVTKA